MLSNTKYLIPYDGGVKVKIKRLNIDYTCYIPYRLFGGYESTWQKARSHRNEIHYLLFGRPFSNRYTHLSKKNSPHKKTFKGFPLPNGISIGFSRGRATYVVSSYSPSPGDIQRKRFNFRKTGFKAAMLAAMKHRSDFEDFEDFDPDYEAK